MNKFLTFLENKWQWVTALVTSSGSGDAGKIVATNSEGKVDITLMPAGLGSDTFVGNASENLAASDLVNLWDDAGTTKVRKASNADPGKSAHGFVSGAVTSGASATVLLDGTITGLSALDTAVPYFLGVDGAVTDTAPTSSGTIIQEVGTSVSATALAFERGTPVEID
jgi:hypothetical protein